MHNLHEHPKSREMIRGHRRGHREMVALGDFCSNNQSGKWERVPDSFDGCGIPQNSAMIFVRPAKLYLLYLLWKRMMDWFRNDEVPDTQLTPQQLTKLGELSEPLSDSWE